MNEIAYSKREVYLTNWWDIKYTYIRRLKQTAMSGVIKFWSWYSRRRHISYILCFTVRCTWVKLSKTLWRSLPYTLWTRPSEAIKNFGYFTTLSVSRLYIVEWLIHWWIINWKDLQGIGCGPSEVIPRHLPEGTEKTTKFLNHGSRCPGQVSNRVPLTKNAEYDSYISLLGDSVSCFYETRV
jgi:hypothetical protein